MAHQTLWNGTQHEIIDLLDAIGRYCTCEFDAQGIRLTTCPPHRMLLEDQRALDGLLFARHMASRWRLEEFALIPADASVPRRASAAGKAH